MNAPILVVQLQRLGDIILTFPLLRFVRRHYPAHPLWVMAEPAFFRELLPLAPDIVFFPPDMAARLRNTLFHLVINLSLRDSAAQVCAGLKADQHFGLYMPAGERRMFGFWQVYRASLTCNNRHNRFHWADLHILDLTQNAALPPLFQPPRTSEDTKRIGLVVGASTEDKHPDAMFWGKLARRLLARGYRPFFLGGKAEMALGEEAARVAGLPAANLCGRFSLSALAGVMKTLDLCITPDTGPMHLAVLLGTPTLNLSLGPVHACETGPVQPEHHVLRAGLSCVGCWSCPHRTPLCKLRFSPERVARTADALLHSPEALPSLPLRGVQLLRTCRDAHGLHTLMPVQGTLGTGREALSLFWQKFFLGISCPAHLEDAQQALAQLAQQLPPLAASLRRHSRYLELEVTRSCTRGLPLEENFWQAHPPLIRPLSAYIHTRLQNEQWRPAAWRTVLDILCRLNAMFP